MAHSSLLVRIMQIAEDKQRECNVSFCAVDFYFLAIRSVVEHPELLEGVSYDTGEYEALKKAFEGGSYVTEETILTKVNHTGFTQEDEAEARNLRRWLLVSSRDSRAVWNKIADDYLANKPVMQPLTENKVSADLPEKEDIREKKKEETAAEPKKAEKKETQTIKDLVEMTVKLRADLLTDVLGQTYAVNKLVDGFFTGELNAETNEKRKGTRSSFLFLGSPGVGKTFLAETFANSLGRPFLRLDMSGYSNESAGVDQLTGIPENYHGSREGELTEFVRKNPKSVVLFDEIEKANTKVILLFLQMLDAGVVVDTKTKKPVQFKDVIVIFTTNAGRQLYTSADYGRLSGVPTPVITDALKKDINPSTGQPYFPEAIVSRLGTGSMILFDNLAAADLIKIAGREMEKNMQNIEEKYAQTIQMDSRMDATILYSLGGNADARNAVAYSKKFISSEYFELLRLVGASKGMDALLALKKIKFKVDLEGASKEIVSLYDNPDEMEMVIFADPAYKWLEECNESGCVIKFCDSLEKFEETIHKDDPAVVIVDYNYNSKSDKKLLSMDDVESEGRKAFETAVKDCPDAKIFVIENAASTANIEEKMSVMDKGASDFVIISADNKEEGAAVINGVYEKVCHQRALESLGLKHMVLSFDTRQSISEDSSTAVITIYDLHLTQAVESEDRKSILSAENKPNKHWEDIVVSKDVKEELTYYIDYLKNPKEFLSKGASVPKGILMYGPPGTGKTSLAKVVATESGVVFLEISADQFISKWIGEGGERVHEMFATARKYAPAILFIDEIDAIGTRRDETGSEGSGAQSTHQILNALLTEMDGFKTSSKKPVFVMAASNLGGNNGNTGTLDPALVRRFDRAINIDLPDKEGRIKILNILRGKNEKMMQISDEIIENLAIRSMGMSPANMEGAFETAVRDAIRSGTIVDDKMLDNAFEKYNSGDEKQWDPSELERTARHEAGHALICNYFGEKPSYLTIVARDNHGGYMLHGDNEKKGSYLKADLLHRICTSLGGRAAELVYYGEEEGLSTGPSGDLENATNIARSMIGRYGMFGKVGLGVVRGSSVSPEQNAKMEECINQILSEQLDEAVRIITENRDKIDKLVAALIEKQHLSEDQIQEALK